MNPYQFTVTCDVCGGDGVGTIRTAGAAWDSRRRLRHTDPRVCADTIWKNQRINEDPISYVRRIAREEREKGQAAFRRLVAANNQRYGIA